MGNQLGFLSETVSSLVHIDCRVPEGHPSASILGTERSGTGVIVEDAGYILTVGYVVMGAKDLRVTPAGAESLEARVVYIDFECGLAVIQAQGLGDRAAALGGSSELCVGAPVVLLASGGEERFRGSQGFITDLGPFDAHWEYMLDSAIKSTAMNPGLGGGALVTMDGKIRGTVSLNLHLIGSCSLSIPIDLFLSRRDLFLGRRPDADRERRPWLGVFPQPLEKGVLVAGVVPGGPADESGIEAGDIVLFLNGEEVPSRRTFYQRLWQGKAGDVVALTIYRGKGFRTIRVISRSRADFYR